MKDLLRLSVFSVGIAGLMVIAAAMPSSTPRQSASLTPEEISWVEFCKNKGYDVHTDDDEIINEFLDAWCGSTIEEETLTRHGVEI